MGCCGSCQGQNGNVGQDGADVGNLQVRGAEIIAPLGDAVCLVNGDERHVHVAQLGDEEVAGESFGRYIEELGAPQDAVLQHAQDVVVRHTAIDGCCEDALLAEVHDLVFHQGDEGGDDNAHPIECHSRHLEGQRLAASCGHEPQRVASQSY